jgi:hypothetical protein
MGPEHEAEIFVKLQRYRKPLVTKDLHAAELLAGGEFGANARTAEAFVNGLDCETVPLSAIRKLTLTKPEAFARIKELVRALVGRLPLGKDFIEGLVYLEDLLGADNSLSDIHSQRLFDMGVERMTAMMQMKMRQDMEGKLAKIASPRMKAEALRWAIFEAGYEIRPLEHQGELIGARVGISHQDVAAD